jgi:hypothetical protein
MDCAFDEFHNAAKPGFEQLDGHDEPTGPQSHESAKRSDFAADWQQRFLPAQNAVIQLFAAADVSPLILFLPKI